MTISAEKLIVAKYSGDGSTVAFTFGFRVFKTADLKVIKRSTSGVETVLVQNTDYTATLNGTGIGGTVTCTVAPAIGEALAITREVAMTQELDLENQGAFFAEDHEKEFDKITAIAQDIAERDERTVRVPITSSQSAEQLVNDLYQARDTAVTKASEAQASASSASTSATNATSAKNDAVAAKEAAENAQEGAEEAKDIAVAAVEDIEQLQATATTLPAGSSATATYTHATHTLALGIPQGAAGADGADGADGEDGLDGGSVVDAEVTSGGNLLLTIDPAYTGNIDDEMSLISENPVQNKVITGTIQSLLPSSRSGNAGKYLKTDGTNTSWESSALDAYPVGAIYLSTVSTSPATLFGGTWEALPQGRVLIGAGENYTAGDTGGEASHSITTSEMPSHNHGGSTGSVGAGGSHSHSVPTLYSNSMGGRNNGTQYYSNETETSVFSYQSGSSNGMPAHSHTISSQGDGTAMSLMQPYLVVFMWKRTA